MPAEIGHDILASERSKCAASDEATWRFAIESTRRALDIERQRTQDACSRLERLEQELNETRRELKDACEQVAQFNRQLHHARQSEGALQQALEVCREEQERCAAERDEREHARERDAALVHQHQELVERQQQTIARLTSQVREHESRAHAAEAQTKERDATIVEQASTIASRDRHLEERGAELERLHRSCDEQARQASAQLRDQERRIGRLSEGNAVLETRCRELEQEVARAQHANAECEAALRAHLGNLRASLEAETRARANEREAFVQKQQQLEAKVCELEQGFAPPAMTQGGEPNDKWVESTNASDGHKSSAPRTQSPPCTSDEAWERTDASATRVAHAQEQRVGEDAWTDGFEPCLEGWTQTPPPVVRVKRPRIPQ